MSQPPYDPPSGPHQGQPNPDVPSSVPPQPGPPPPPSYTPPPGHPQPGYPQPGYPQQGYPQQGYPQSGYPLQGGGPAQPGHPYGGPPQAGPPLGGYPQTGYPQGGPPVPGFPAAPRKSRAVPITLVSVALVLVLCVGGGAAIYLVGRNAAAGFAETASSAGPTPEAAPTTKSRPAVTIRIVEPKTLGGRPKVTDPAFAEKVEQVERDLAKVPGASQAVGALYGTPSKRNLVMVVAARSLVIDPKTELDSAFTGPDVEELKLTGLTSVPAGPLGGVAKCAKGNGGGAPLSMCAWADEGSSGWMIWYFTALSKAKREFVKLRGQVEKKSN